MESIFFGPFCLDPESGRLMGNGQAIPITPKAFAVLHCLLQRPGKLITKRELLAGVWPRRCVGDSVLKVCIRELRQALGDACTQPRFIETAHRRGYRFVARTTGVAHRFEPEALAETPGCVVNEQKLSSAGDRAPSRSLDVGFLGRQRELDQLEASLRNACQGERQLVFVTGEVGIGKSTLIEAFLSRTTGTASVCVARGHAFEHWINEQEYAAVIEALQGLCRDPQGARPLDHLRRWAPTWLLEIPSVVKPEERTLPEPHRSTRQRMFPEIADFVEAVTSEQPMILVLEDLHWSDHATIDLISYLARLQSPAAFMLIGSFRGNEVITKNHPVKALVEELKIHKACVELRIEGLSELAVREFVARRIRGKPHTAKLAQILYDQTEGSPLLILEMMDHWIEHNLVNLLNDAGDMSDCSNDIRLGIPDAIRELVNRQFDLLPAYDRHVLKAASATALKFSAEAVAVLLDEDVIAVEECCEHLAHQQQFLYSLSSTRRPERRGASRYSFIHRLYKQVIFLGVPIARRTQLCARNKRSAVNIRAAL